MERSQAEGILNEMKGHNFDVKGYKERMVAYWFGRGTEVNKVTIQTSRSERSCLLVDLQEHLKLYQSTSIAAPPEKKKIVPPPEAKQSKAEEEQLESQDPEEELIEYNEKTFGCRKIGEAGPKISFSRKCRIAINQNAAALLDLTGSDRLAVVQLGKNWFVTKSTDGFGLKKDRTYLVLYHKRLVEKLFVSIGCELDSLTFMLKEGPIKQKGYDYPLFQLDIKE